MGGGGKMVCILCAYGLYARHKDRLSTIRHHLFSAL